MLRFPLVLAIAVLTWIGGPVLSQPASPNANRSSVSTAMDRVERHITMLHNQLAIIPSQQSLWESFAAVMRMNARRMEEAHNAAASSGISPNAVADMRSYAASIRLHAEDVDRLLPVFEALYATMNPDQRAKADKLFQQSRRDRRRRGSD